MTAERVRVYAARSLVPPGAPHSPFLEPLWGPSGDKYEDPRSPLAGRFDAWREQGAELLEEAPLEEADVAVLPASCEHYLKWPERLAAAVAHAERIRESGLPLVAFFHGDSTEPLPLAGAYVYRTSLLRSQPRERERLLPAFARDVAADLGGPPPAREWRPRPVVGFCGYVPDRGLGGAARRLLGRPPHPAAVRGVACRLLNRSESVETSFVFRPAYWAGAVAPAGELDYAVMRAAREKFVRNLVESDYVLAVRGGGNFSVRLYEALSCGRIPVFVDTDSVLPREDAIDWRSLCVWLDADELREIGERVAAVHAELGPVGFRERQEECRRAYLEWLTPEAFFRFLVPGLRSLTP